MVKPKSRLGLAGIGIASLPDMQQPDAPEKRARQRKDDHRWSARVTRESDALDLEQGVFLRGDPASVARSLKDSADKSKRRKAEPYRSAMSMLVFYINRAGSNLSKRRRAVLEQAKDELRKLYGRPGRKQPAR